MGQDWVPIQGMEDAYEISRSGSVRSKTRKIVRSDGRSYIHQGEALKPARMPHGYLRVQLTFSGKTRRAYIHRLLAEAFIPNPEGLPIVRHLNDVPDDNRLENLAWGTPKDNARDRNLFNKGHHNSLKRECPKGHPYDEANTLKLENGRRACRTCSTARVKQFHDQAVGKEPPKHGTIYAYSTFKCRCDLCTKANTDYYRELRERRKEV